MEVHDGGGLVKEQGVVEVLRIGVEGGAAGVLVGFVVGGRGCGGALTFNAR